MTSRWWICCSILLVVCIFQGSAYAQGDCADLNYCYSQWQQGSCVNGSCVCTYPDLFTGDDCSINQDIDDNWDNIECLHGGRFYPPFMRFGWRRYCVCPPGHAGVDCSICSTDLGCAYLNTENTTYRCDNSIYPQQQKNYNCTITEPALIGLMSGSGVATATCTFPGGLQVGGNCVMTFFIRDTGVPKLFNCTFLQCGFVVDQFGVQTITCQTSACNGTTFLGVISQLAEQARTTMTLTCQPSGACTWIQKEISDSLPSVSLQCGAGECVAVNNTIIIDTQPPTTYMRIIIVVSVGAGVLVLAVLLSVVGYSVLRLHKVYNPLPHIEATLSFHNVSCSINEKNGKKRVILESVSGAMQPGHVTAIMGASGAGKTTFLDILSGRKNTGIVTGDICVNGEPRNRSFKRLAGYVTQDDVFMGTLTVREHLGYVALLRLPAHMPREAKMKRVDDCLAELGIAHIANSRIGTDTSRGISGGERKRLAIASELVVDPSILILDEPTSGLDSYSASTLIQTLHALAKKNRTIVMSIHQPRSDIFHMFDYLMVFAHGRAVYFGEGSGALGHFATLGYQCPPNFNPADFIIDTVSNPQFKDIARTIPQRVEPQQLFDWNEVYSDTSSPNLPPRSPNNVPQSPTLLHSPHSPNMQRKSVNRGVTNSAKVDLAEVDEYASSFFTQFQVLTHRTFLNSFRNPFLLRVQFLLHILAAVLLGYLYHGLSYDLQHGGFQNRMGSLFFIVTLLSFGSITSIDLFFSERLLFLRERATGCYRTSAYFLSKAVSDLVPMRIIPPLILGSIIYFWIGYQAVLYKFIVFLCTLVALSVTATNLNFVISSLAPSVAVGNLIAILLLFLFLIFGGFLVNIENMPKSVHWITNLSYLTFSYSILMVNEFDGIFIDIDPNGLNTHTIIAGQVLLEQWGMSIHSMAKYMIGLGVMLGGYLVLAYLALRFAVKEKR